MYYFTPKIAIKAETLFRLTNAKYPVIKVMGSLQKKLINEIKETQKNFHKQGKKKLLVSSLALLSVLSLNPAIIAGATTTSIAYNSFSTHKSPFLADYTFSYFKYKGEMILFLFHESYDAEFYGVKGFEDFDFHLARKQFECLCGLLINDKEEEDPYEEYYCPNCGRRMVRRY